MLQLFCVLLFFVDALKSPRFFQNVAKCPDVAKYSEFRLVILRAGCVRSAGLEVPEGVKLLAVPAEPRVLDRAEPVLRS